jgi:hypothetical protein
MNEQDLRDVFAMFALLGIIINDKALDDRAPHRAYLMADLALEARSAEKVGLPAIKRKARSK